jgi:hypothetical protein
MEVSDARWFATARAMAALDQFETAATPKVREVMRSEFPLSRTEPTAETAVDGTPALRVVEEWLEKCRKCVDSGTAGHLDAQRACWDTFALVSIIHEHLPLFAKVDTKRKEEWRKAVQCSSRVRARSSPTLIKRSSLTFFSF